jgi:hypothetical protein
MLLEKGKNEPIESFACAPVEAELCPPASFLDCGTGASEKNPFDPRKTFFSSIGLHQA